MSREGIFPERVGQLLLTFFYSNTYSPVYTVQYSLQFSATYNVQYTIKHSVQYSVQYSVRQNYTRGRKKIVPWGLSQISQSL